MEKAVVYARYSSHGQNEMSIESQLRICREYAEQKGLSIVKIYNDKAKTAFKDIDWPLYELYDLEADPMELNNIYDNPENKDIVNKLKNEMYALKEYYQDFE